MLHEKRHQRPKKRPQSDHDGIRESETQPLNQNPEEYLRNTPPDTKQNGGSKPSGGQSCVSQKQVMDQTQRESPRKNNQGHQTEDEPRVLPSPFAIELEGKHAAARHQAGDQ